MERFEVSSNGDQLHAVCLMKYMEAKVLFVVSDLFLITCFLHFCMPKLQKKVHGVYFVVP